MKHNLFSHPTEINIVFEDGNMKLEKICESQKIIDILEDIDYDTDEIRNILYANVDKETYEILDKYLNDNNYLKTTWS
jgi:arginine decarboxylase